MTCRFSLLHPFSFTNTSNSYVETNLNRQVVLGYMFLSAPQARPWVKLFIDTQQPMPRSFFNMITQDMVYHFQRKGCDNATSVMTERAKQIQKNMENQLIFQETKLKNISRSVSSF
ncbi:hypothetical protein QUC31_019471 [Theobroma cacao]|nr:hypothetical protein QQP08_024412 [Theobroma cacao]